MKQIDKLFYRHFTLVVTSYLQALIPSEDDIDRLAKKKIADENDRSIHHRISISKIPNKWVDKNGNNIKSKITKSAGTLILTADKIDYADFLKHVVPCSIKNLNDWIEKRSKFMNDYMTLSYGAEESEIRAQQYKETSALLRYYFKNAKCNHNNSNLISIKRLTRYLNSFSETTDGFFDERHLSYSESATAPDINLRRLHHVFRALEHLQFLLIATGGMPKILVRAFQGMSGILAKHAETKNGSDNENVGSSKFITGDGTNSKLEFIEPETRGIKTFNHVLAMQLIDYQYYEEKDWVSLDHYLRWISTNGNIIQGGFINDKLAGYTMSLPLHDKPGQLAVEGTLNLCKAQPEDLFSDQKVAYEKSRYPFIYSVTVAEGKHKFSILKELLKSLAEDVLRYKMAYKKNEANIYAIKATRLGQALMEKFDFKKSENQTGSRAETRVDGCDLYEFDPATIGSFNENMKFVLKRLGVKERS